MKAIHDNFNNPSKTFFYFFLAVIVAVTSCGWEKKYVPQRPIECFLTDTVRHPGYREVEYAAFDGGRIFICDTPVITNADIAYVLFPKEVNGIYVVLTSEGGKKFADFTKRNKYKFVATYIDSVFVSLPRIAGTVSGGRFTIEWENKVTKAEADSLINAIRGIKVKNGVKSGEKEFSISLPPGWVEIPEDAIKASIMELVRLAPGAAPAHIDYACQLGSSANWFEYPYIIISANNAGRWPYSKWRNIEHMGQSLLQDGAEIVKEKFGPLLAGLQVDKFVYDRQRKIIWMNFGGKSTNKGEISGIIGTIPTERGFIQAAGFSSKANFQAFEPVFKSIAASIVLRSDLVYKLKWSDRLPSAIAELNMKLRRW